MKSDIYKITNNKFIFLFSKYFIFLILIFFCTGCLKVDFKINGKKVNPKRLFKKADFEAYIYNKDGSLDPVVFSRKEGIGIYKHSFWIVKSKNIAGLLVKHNKFGSGLYTDLKKKKIKFRGKKIKIKTLNINLNGEKDTDKDGYTDYDEIKVHGTDPFDLNSNPGGVCGDGIVNIDEQCDGIGIVSCSIDGYVGVKECLPDCTFSVCNPTEFCGDGIVQTSSWEECDDGNNASNDGCSSSCQTEFCGDGIIQDGLQEGCDDGNSESGDGCNANCIEEYCGDGIHQPDLGEICDSSSPQTCSTPEGYIGTQFCNNECSGFDECASSLYCGDGICSESAETVFNCFEDCPNICGNGFLEQEEECDDGNNTSNDGCSSSCIHEFCGDGIVQDGLDEECDDGNTEAFDGCSENCINETCNLVFNIENAQPEQLTDNDQHEYHLKVSKNGLASWVLFSPDYSSSEVFFYNGENISQLTSDSKFLLNLDINSNGNITWMNLNNSGIYYYNGVSPVEITTPTPDIYHSSPRINESGTIVWYSYFVGTDNNFLSYILSFSSDVVTEITNGTHYDILPKINTLGNIAWVRREETSKIMIYDGTSANQVDEINYTVNKIELSDNNNIVWEGKLEDTDTQIFYYDGYNSIQISSDYTYNGKPKINAQGQAVWESGNYVEDVLDENSLEIMYFDGNTTVQITNNNYMDTEPRISDEGYIVWSGFDGNDFEIYIYDGAEIYQLTDNTIDDYSPEISDNSVFWLGMNIIDLEVYKLDFKACDYSPQAQ